jgi:NADPH-dependent 2,4-dienoyl-CoA reductase/sulfur reductase-like enzyme/ferredoxin
MTDTIARANDRQAPATIPFPNFTQAPRHVPVRAWHPVRALSVAVFLGLCVALFVRPAGGLFVFWKVLVPLLPITFLVAPGLWRNVCPLAAANQAPRLWKITRAAEQSPALRKRGYAAAIVFFTAIVATRRPLLDKNGSALSILLLGLIVAAFATGARWKGKSGWCSSLCPLLPVQRLYGQTPFVNVPNSHCQPCVGCTTNCYDFNPRAAYQADMHEPDPEWSAPRKLFAGAFPGLIAGFFTLPAHPSAVAAYGHILLFAAIGAGVFFALDAIIPVTSSKLAALGGAVAINLFYWYQGPLMAHTWSTVVGHDVGWLSTIIRVVIPLATVVWLARTVVVERRFTEQAVASAVPVKLTASRTAKLTAQTAASGTEVSFLPDERRIPAEAGASLLEVAEGCGQAIEAGCRMAMCGSDPIAVLDGMDNLTPITDDEANTLRRLGLGPTARLACSARVEGPVCVSLASDALAAAASDGATATRPTHFDPTIEKVVVIGNGIAGITAADFIRREHPDCEIHVIGKEAHHLYNRMGISRIVYGRSAMQGLHLLPDTWYDDHRITCWLNTRVHGIDTDAGVVDLATGDKLGYDRLILANGCSSFVPPLPGFGMAGTFVLREADDAIAIRRYAQDVGVKTAVVAGAGLLGLEVAHSLRSLGLSTTVIERGVRLLSKQVDEAASRLLGDFLANLGIRVVSRTSIERINGGQDGRVQSVSLADDTELPADLVLVAAGIRPNIDLARAAGLEVNRGVIVDDHMRTSAPHVYAAGDVAEFNGQVYGLWPIAVGQAEVAARNAVGGDHVYENTPPPTLLKGVGIDLLSTGRITLIAGDSELVIDQGDRGHPRYVKLVVSTDRRVVGALVVGRPQDHSTVIEAVKHTRELGELTRRLDNVTISAL